MWYSRALITVTDSTVNKSTSDSMARVTASAYNQNIDKRIDLATQNHAMVCKIYNSKYYF